MIAYAEAIKALLRAGFSHRDIIDLTKLMAERRYSNSAKTQLKTKSRKETEQMDTLLETKDGIKQVTYFSPKFAAKVLTPEGWGRWTTGQVIRLQDTKPEFLGRNFDNALGALDA